MTTSKKINPKKSNPKKSSTPKAQTKTRKTKTSTTSSVDPRQAPHAHIQVNGSLPVSSHLVINPR